MTVEPWFIQAECRESKRRLRYPVSHAKFYFGTCVVTLTVHGMFMVVMCVNKGG